ncbi:MAG: hypothetical protein ACHREM_00240 [Polyangiales bacterium]
MTTRTKTKKSKTVKKKTKNDDHVVVRNGGGFKCLHCGAKEDVTFPMPMDVYIFWSRRFADTHAKCKKRDLPEEPPPKTPQEWIRGEDTGRSSICLCFAATGLTAGRMSMIEGWTPLDPSDFGRCYRFLKLFPNLNVAPAGERWPHWKPFVEAWPELTALYEEELPSGAAPKLYARLRQLNDAIKRTVSGAPK